MKIRGIFNSAASSRHRLRTALAFRLVGQCQAMDSRQKGKDLKRLLGRPQIPQTGHLRRRHETEFKARWVPLLPRESAKKTFNVGDRSLPERHALFPRRIDAWRA